MKQIVKKAVGIFLFLWANQLAGLAQFSDTVNHYINFSGTGNLNKTNTGTTYLLNNTARFQVNKKKISLNSMAGYVYGRNPTIKTNDDFLATLNLDFLKDVQKFYYWALTGYEKSFSLKVDSRFQAGAGVGYVFVNSDKANLELSDGFLFETTDLGVVDVHGRTSYQAARNSLRLKYRFLIKEIVRIDGTNFFQPSLSDGRDYILKLNTSVSVNLYKWLNFTTSFNYNRQNITSTENLLMTYGLSMEKYF
ncbi:MAG: DUF481 domain-containing protein [Candidatus Pseudobacter hemicellulosilyticus]|uniref:DUF481 domain-containing protein n=1 Tax=Candidatus Pseudobacter hemicellulosilyticus TaxID=3121375 RepID=A0AAJ5WNV6_9BACT|nr:MAG: DUF481 domain-containing protein [Pseudobacter sp.]